MNEAARILKFLKDTVYINGIEGGKHSQLGGTAKDNILS